jgi:hypothetical protein
MPEGYVIGDGGNYVAVDPRILERIAIWCAKLEERYNERNPHGFIQTYTPEALRRYIRINCNRDDPITSRSVHAFVDPSNGDVLKSASWSKPAKIARFNLLDDESFQRMLDTCDWSGGYLYIR